MEMQNPVTTPPRALSPRRSSAERGSCYTLINNTEPAEFTPRPVPPLRVPELPWEGHPRNPCAPPGHHGSFSRATAEHSRGSGG